MYTLELNEEQLTILDRALAELPYKIVAPLVHSLQDQLASQLSTEEATESE